MFGLCIWCCESFNPGKKRWKFVKKLHLWRIWKPKRQDWIPDSRRTGDNLPLQHQKPADAGDRCRRNQRLCLWPQGKSVIRNKWGRSLKSIWVWCSEPDEQLHGNDRRNHPKGSLSVQRIRPQNGTKHCNRGCSPGPDHPLYLRSDPSVP